MLITTKDYVYISSIDLLVEKIKFKYKYITLIFNFFKAKNDFNKNIVNKISRSYADAACKNTNVHEGKKNLNYLPDFTLVKNAIWLMF